MRRREFITLVGGAVVARPMVARAQQTAMPVIGFLVGPTPSTARPWVDAFVQRLRELGWIERQTIVIEFRWADGRNERYTDIASEFVRLKVDVIVTPGSAGAAAKQATSLIPIVFTAAPDPLGTGLVASLARPGGNATGLSVQFTDLASKRIELLREVVHGLRRVAIMANVANASSVLEMQEALATARKVGLDVIPVEVRGAEDIVSAFQTLRGQAEALYICSDPLMTTNRVRIYILAAGAQLPTICGFREHVDAVLLCPMDPTFRTCSGALLIWSTKFFTARNRPISRSSSQPSSNSSLI